MRWYSFQGLLEGSISEKGESCSILNASRRIQRELDCRKVGGRESEMKRTQMMKGKGDVNRINVEHMGNNNQRE